MYDPGIGRWLEEDPEGFGAGDANLYRYVHNGPTNYTDPSGLQQRSTRSIADLYADYQLYQREAGATLTFEQWRAREEGRPDPTLPRPGTPGDNPLGPTPAQQQRDLQERQDAQARNFPETPGIGSLTPLEQQLLNEQLRRLEFNLVYYQFWFYDVPGALSGLVPTGGTGVRSAAMPRRAPARAQAAAQTRFLSDLARVDRICAQMRARGDTDQAIGRWRADASANADGRLFRALDQLSDTVPQFPAPTGIQD